jgi:transglutaminase-like putative cysteine protease
MNYRISHKTVYEYAAPVAVSHHVARLEPRVTSAQTPENFSLKISPQPVLRKVRADYFGNQLCFFSVQENHQHLEITAASRVSVRSQETPAPETSPSWEEVAKLFCDPVAPEVIDPYQFVFDSPQVHASFELADYARESFQKGTPLLVGALDLTRRIFEDFKYDAKATTIATPLEEVLQKRRGVCQDFAHLGIACLRSLGLPARYISGYLRTRPPEGKEKRIGADASHAWFSIFCPRNGWNDYDPTNNLRVAEEHITVAYGRDFGDVSPVAGILTGGGQHEVKVSVDVEEISAA